MEHDRSKKNGDRHPPEDGADSAGTGRREYTVGINGVEITVLSETGREKARKLLESAEKVNALVTELDEKTILEDDDRIYEGDDEVDLQKPKPRIFIAIQKYEGTETLLERIRHLLPDDSVYSRRPW